MSGIIETVMTAITVVIVISSTTIIPVWMIGTSVNMIFMFLREFPKNLNGIRTEEDRINRTLNGVLIVLNVVGASASIFVIVTGFIVILTENTIRSLLEVIV